jgi:chloramphenicol-sensitive protein RarD
MGFLQFIAPTLQYFTAVYITGEIEDPNRIVCFIFVWSALALYTADTLYFLHGRRRVRAVESPVVASS